MNQANQNAPASAGNPVPVFLATQLLTAAVYADFLEASSTGERGLWQKMLDDELAHAAHFHKLLSLDSPQELSLPLVNAERMWDTAGQIRRQNRGAFLLRLEGALRLEVAELDCGLEGLVARRLERSHLLHGYRMDIQSHLSWLLEESSRYRESPNIGLQMRRLEEILETSLRDTGTIPASGEEIPRAPSPLP